MEDRTIDIRISGDKMQALLSIKADEENFPGREEILEKLDQAGVKFGIKDEKLDSIIENKDEVNSVEIASGKYPAKGKDGRLIWYIEPDQEYKPHIDDDGKADYWTNKKISQVNKGDEIVTKLPPTAGTPGKTVTGEEFTIKGNDISLPKGKNVTVSEDGLTLIAEHSGHLEYKNGSISISKIYRINGDVDFSTGNIKYNGKVHISGDVRSGFKVEANDSIIIDGNVEASHIYSRNGDIHINLGIVGKERANILAGGNVYCGYVQGAKINVSKSVFIEHYAINSEIYAGERVVSLRNEGLLRGGKIYSEDGIEVKEIGSENRVQTEIGINFNYSRFNAELQELSDQAKKKESELELVSKKIKFLKLLNQRLDELSDKKQEEYKNLLYKAKNLKEELQSIEDKKDELNAITDEDFKDKLIIVRGKIYNEVEINMGNLQHKLDQQYESVKIYRDSNNICIQKL